MIDDIAAVLDIEPGAVIAATCSVACIAGVFAVLAGQLAFGRISRRWQARRGIRQLESFANHPANRSRKEKP
ncbi:hypothetical protein [Streptomyces sp. NPDC020747]|uniref:hypothetical protein n=1 Tax=Streptomyces sp. NPDC020747 TaxID=3365086 RepID=UPI00379F47E0